MTRFIIFDLFAFMLVISGLNLYTHTLVCVYVGDQRIEFVDTHSSLTHLRPVLICISSYFLTCLRLGISSHDLFASHSYF